DNDVRTCRRAWMTDRAGGDAYAVVEPATGKEIGDVTAGGEREAVAAVDAAAGAMAGWRGVPIPRRAARLRGIAGRPRGERHGRLADSVARETGKCRREALAELALAADYFDYYADLGHALADRAALAMRPGVRHLVQTGPVGVAAV